MFALVPVSHLTFLRHFREMKMKQLNAHLNVLKLTLYYLLLTCTLMTLAMIVAFCAQSISVSLIRDTPEKSLSFVEILRPSQTHSVSNDRLSVLSNEGVALKSRSSGLQRELRGIESDEDLMKRALIVPEMEDMVSEQEPKIAFMFMIKGSLPLASLWEEFFKGHEGFYSIYVHSDSTAYNYSSKLETGVFRGRMIPSKEVKWAKFSMVEAELRLIANALLDSSNKRFILLSESCIPVFNFPIVYSYLMNSTKTYIETYDQAGHAGRGRYQASFWPKIKRQQWRKGSQWFEMDRDLAIKVISDQDYLNTFKSVCEAPWSSCCADEHYLPTWVNTYYGETNANRSLTWADWSQARPHPAKYRREHITAELLNRIRSNQTCLYNGTSTNICYLFARKFAPDTLGRLLRLAPEVMNF